MLPKTDKDHVTKGMIYLFIAYFFFTCMYSLNKLLAHQAHVIEIAFYRNVISAALLAVFIVSTQQYSVIYTRHPWMIFVRVVVGTISLVLTFAATQALPLSSATALFFASTLLIPIMAIFFLREHVGWHRWAAIIFGLLGVLCVIRPSLDVSLMGVILALTAAVGHATVQILLRALRQEHHLTITFYFFSGGAVMTGIGMPFVAHFHDLQTWGILLAIGIMGALGQLFSTAGYQLAPASVLAPLAYTGLLWATLLDITIWGLIPDAYVYIGAGMIVSAQIYILHRERRHTRKAKEQDMLLEL